MSLYTNLDIYQVDNVYTPDHYITSHSTWLQNHMAAFVELPHSISMVTVMSTPCHPNYINTSSDIDGLLPNSLLLPQKVYFADDSHVAGRNLRMCCRDCRPSTFDCTRCMYFGCAECSTDTTAMVTCVEGSCQVAAHGFCELLLEICK